MCLTKGIAKKRDEFRPPIPNCAQMIEEGGPTVWLGQASKLWVLVWQVRVFMVREVEIAKPEERLQNKQADQVSSDFIKCLTFERCKMRAFVL